MALSAAGILACASPASNNTGAGGSSPTGGNNGNGGSNSGNGGSNTGNGGSNSGNGGSNTGSGGSNTGSGGVNTGAGGTNTGAGGSHTGGTTGAGGTNTGAGGTNTGAGGTNTGAGGSHTGGTTGAGGSATGGAGGAFSGSNPPGYYMTKDWSVTSADWHGCVWTGKDSTVTGSTTSVTPQDFTAATKEGGPYEVSGTVYNDYNAVAMLGFNLNEAATGDSTQCKYNAAAATAAGPPAATVPSSATGIAVNWSAKTAPPTSFRIQIQGVDGATNAAHRWCATITDPSGPSFVPFTSFYPSCWNVGTTMSPGTAYAGEAIDAVVFLVPGTVAQKAPFDFTITGFAPGTSKADAPGGSAACGTTTGTLGSTTASMAASYQRAAVTGTDCKKYIVQNNNWGNPTGSTQVINYTGTGFTVTSSSGSGSSAPASFPSAYVGANGDLSGGTYNTWSDTGLPKQISAMTSAVTSFSYSGGGGGRNFNVTYDIWFAKSPPTAGSYNDAVSGFIMLWLYKPANNQPIGTKVRTATINGVTFDVWAGPRNTTATGTDGSGRPVISYVANPAITSVSSFDLKKLFDDAVSAKDSSNGISQTFSNTWYLTDVFAGFEIWTGSDAAGLKGNGFQIAVK